MVSCLHLTDTGGKGSHGLQRAPQPESCTWTQGWCWSAFDGRRKTVVQERCWGLVRRASGGESFVCGAGSTLYPERSTGRVFPRGALAEQLRGSKQAAARWKKCWKPSKPGNRCGEGSVRLQARRARGQPELRFPS